MYLNLSNSSIIEMVDTWHLAINSVLTSLQQLLLGFYAFGVYYHAQVSLK